MSGLRAKPEPIPERLSLVLLKSAADRTKAALTLYQLFLVSVLVSILPLFLRSSDLHHENLINAQRILGSSHLFSTEEIRSIATNPDVRIESVLDINPVLHPDSTIRAFGWSGQDLDDHSFQAETLAAVMNGRTEDQHLLDFGTTYKAMSTKEQKNIDLCLTNPSQLYGWPSNADKLSRPTIAYLIQLDFQRRIYALMDSKMLDDEVKSIQLRRISPVTITVPVINFTLQSVNATEGFIVLSAILLGTTAFRARRERRILQVAVNSHDNREDFQTYLVGHPWLTLKTSGKNAYQSFKQSNPLTGFTGILFIVLEMAYGTASGHSSNFYVIGLMLFGFIITGWGGVLVWGQLEECRKIYDKAFESQVDQSPPNPMP